MAINVVRSAVLIFTLIVGTTCVRAEDGAPADPGYIDSIWQVQELQFNFHSFNTRYGCGALERKVADILRAVGARPDVAVSAGCRGAQLLNAAQVSIALASPVPATAENIERATTFDPRARLLARVRNVSLPGPADIQRFGASWERVSLTRNRQLRFSSSDCELIAAMNRDVFPKLSVRLNTRSFSCFSAATRIRPRVELAALIASPVIPVARR